MPIYDYLCPKCLNQEEHLVKDYAVTISCPKCKLPMRKQVGAANFRIYGAGVHKPNKR